MQGNIAQQRKQAQEGKHASPHLSNTFISFADKLPFDVHKLGPQPLDLTVAKRFDQASEFEDSLKQDNGRMSQDGTPTGPACSGCKNCLAQHANQQPDYPTQHRKNRMHYQAFQ